MKKITITLILILGLGIILGSYVYIKSLPSSVVNSQIPGYLSYQTKFEIVPQKDLVSTLPFEEKEGEYYCKNSNQKAERVDYYSYNPGKWKTGGWSFRYALECAGSQDGSWDNGGQYWIVDGSDATGVNFYGPYSIDVPTGKEI